MDFSMEGNNSNLAKILKSEVSYNELPKILEALRKPILKLSETNFTKNLYNDWKRSGILDKLDINENVRKWGRFSIMKIVILDVVNTLWHLGFDNEIIKEVIDGLLDDTAIDKLDSVYMHWSISDSIAQESGIPYDNEEFERKLEKNIDLLIYFNSQAIENPHLPNISWVEAMIIGVLRTNRPYSIIIKGKEIRYFTTDFFTDDYHKNWGVDFYKESFTNISINDLVQKILKNVDTDDNNKLYAAGKLINSFVQKTTSNDTLKEKALENPNLKYVEEELPKSVNIEHSINEYQDQDFKIVIRSGKKVFIRRSYLTNKK
jgi:hypothetical protein